MRYTIRRVGPAHALGLGCIVGLVLALLPALGMILLTALIRNSAARVLDSLGPLGIALVPRLDLPWNTVGLSVFLLLVFSGLFYAVGAWLVALGYNLVARLTGGLALDVAPDVTTPAAQPVIPVSLPSAAPKDPTMPLPRPFPNPTPPPVGSMPAGPLSPPATGAVQPAITPAPAAGPSRLPPLAPVLAASPAVQPWLISIADSNLHWELRKQVTSIGSDPSNDIVLANDADVAAKHAEIRVESSGYVIHNLSAAADTSVNDRPVPGRNLLKDGFRIRIGKTDLLFRLIQ